MKRKGFTLIEILGVVAILGIIALVAVPNIISSLKNASTNKIKMYQNQLLQGAEIYVEQNRDLFTDRLTQSAGSSFLLKVNDAVVTGYIKSTFVNPTDNKPSSSDDGCVRVTINADGTLSYDYVAGSETACQQTSTLADAAPAVTVVISAGVVGTDHMVINATIANNGTTLDKLEYYIDGKLTYVDNNKSTSYTIDNLINSHTYTIRAIATSVNGKVRRSNDITVTTKDIKAPTFSATTPSSIAYNGVSSMQTYSTQVTISYPTVPNQSLTYEYSLDNGATWVSASQVQNLTLSNSTLLKTRIKDGYNTVETNDFDKHIYATTVQTRLQNGNGSMGGYTAIAKILSLDGATLPNYTVHDDDATYMSAQTESKSVSGDSTTSVNIFRDVVTVYWIKNGSYVNTAEFGTASEKTSGGTFNKVVNADGSGYFYFEYPQINWGGAGADVISTKTLARYYYNMIFTFTSNANLETTYGTSRTDYFYNCIGINQYTFIYDTTGSDYSSYGGTKTSSDILYKIPITSTKTTTTLNQTGHGDYQIFIHILRQLTLYEVYFRAAGNAVSYDILENV
jgi:prepilin-type N-terminal cleavage/methylation domain-containing protein